MATPRLFVGGDGGRLYAPDPTVVLDDTSAITVLGETNVSAPAGPSGECIFPMLYLTTKRFGNATLAITPIVDGVRLTTHTLTLTGATSPQGTVEVNEIDLAEPWPSALAEQIRNAPRGSSLALEIAGPAALVEVSVAQIEYEVVRESRGAVA